MYCVRWEGTPSGKAWAHLQPEASDERVSGNRGPSDFYSSIPILQSIVAVQRRRDTFPLEMLGLRVRGKPFASLE